jgi:hypothetical protein
VCRHVVEFLQNTISGKRVLTVDGEEVFRVNAKYKLTGNVDFVVDGKPSTVAIDAGGACVRGMWPMARCSRVCSCDA